MCGLSYSDKYLFHFANKKRGLVLQSTSPLFFPKNCLLHLIPSRL